MILGVIQARMSSTRFPGKVLEPILGQPMLWQQVKRVQKCSHIDRLVVATSDDRSDDPIAQLCQDKGVDCYRGSLNDVLDRFYQAALTYKADAVVRLTADCPLSDPQVIDEVISFFKSNGFDYASNIIQRTYPDGLDVEILQFDTLEKIWSKAVLDSEREHVTQYIHTHPDEFFRGAYQKSEDTSALRLTVDYPEDLTLIRIIYETLYKENQVFLLTDIERFLSENKELYKINHHYTH